MTLLIVIFLLIVLSLITNIFKKRNIRFSFICFSVLSILFFYLFLSVSLLGRTQILPNNENQIYAPCGNFYNELIKSILDNRLNIFDNIVIPKELYPNYNKIIKKYHYLKDTSLYKGKIYLYFGITPTIIFYLPFHLLTNLYLTDKLLTLILSYLSFLFSLFLLYSITKRYINIPISINIVTIFFIGFCNLLPFLIVRSFIYQVAVITANVLLLGAFCLFYYFANTKNNKFQNVFVFFISLSLCLAVGARPHYVLFIPIFFFSIIYLKYKESAKTDNIFKTILIFLMPCIIYGSIIALYNYLRFDSIFEFGWKYQLNEHQQINYVPSLKDFIIGLKNNFLLLPNMNEHTFFSLVNTSGHRIGNEYIAGVLWTCPIITILILIPHFLRQIYVKSKKNFVFLVTLLLVIIMSIIITSFFGMIIRYIFEFLSLMLILSIVIFMFYINETKDKTLKNFLIFLFISIFIFSMFINISLLFCEENFWNFQTLANTNYSKIVNFLF